MTFTSLAIAWRFWLYLSWAELLPYCLVSIFYYSFCSSLLSAGSFSQTVSPTFRVIFVFWPYLSPHCQSFSALCHPSCADLISIFSVSPHRLLMKLPVRIRVKFCLQKTVLHRFKQMNQNRYHLWTTENFPPDRHSYWSSFGVPLHSSKPYFDYKHVKWDGYLFRKPVLPSPSAFSYNIPPEPPDF